MSTLAMVPPRRGPDVEIELPGSKSITNRYLLLAALARGVSHLSRVLIADDTEAMLDCISAFGAAAVVDADHSSATVTGVDGLLPASGSAFARQSGTTARFVAPLLALGGCVRPPAAAPTPRPRPRGPLPAAAGRLQWGAS